MPPHFVAFRTNSFEETDMLRCSALPRGLVTAGVLRVQSKPAHISDRKSFVRNKNIDNIYRASGSKNFGNTRMGANVLHISSLQQSLLSTAISNIGNTHMGANVRHVSSFQQSLLSTFISKVEAPSLLPSPHYLFA